MRLGILNEKQTEGGKKLITGEVSTYAMRLGFQLVENTDKQSENSPTHLIYASGKHGGQFHAGMAWAGETREVEPKPMYSLLFAIPELFDGEMRYMAWQETPCKYRIEESKPQEQAAA